MKWFILLIYSFAFFSACADEAGVAVVKKVFGSAKIKHSNGKISNLVENQSVDEGDFIQTAEQGVVKLVFIDNTQVVISNNTKFYIASYPKNEAGVFEVLQGEIRSLVSKIYPKLTDKNKSKLYLRTKTAAIGIRGTDFQLNYDAEEENTSLITFHGRVAMNAVEYTEIKLDRDQLEEILNQHDAVLIEDGHASVVDRSLSHKIMRPVRINLEQFKSLKAVHSELLDHSKEKHAPEGLDVPDGIPVEERGYDSSVKGFMNKSTGEYKAPDGSVIDLEKSTIIPLPRDAEFDKKTNMFKVPKQLGLLNKESGRFIPRRDISTAAREGFKAKDGRPIQAASERKDNRREKTERPRERERERERERPKERERPEINSPIKK